MTTYGYDADGRLTSILDAEGRPTTVSYDSYGGIQVSHRDGQEHDFTFERITEQVGSYESKGSYPRYTRSSGTDDRTDAALGVAGGATPTCARQGVITL